MRSCRRRARTSSSCAPTTAAATWNERDGKGWSNSSVLVELSQITKDSITLVNPDTSRSVFEARCASGNYVSVDGAGAYEVIRYDKPAKRYHLTRSNQSVLTFDQNGDLLASRDPNGNAIEFIYAQGRLQSVKDDQGHVITYVYAQGNLVRVQDETGAVLVQYEYAQNRPCRRHGPRRRAHRLRLRQQRRPAQPHPALGRGEPSAPSASNTPPAQRTPTAPPACCAGSPMPRATAPCSTTASTPTTTASTAAAPPLVVNALGLNRRESNAAEYVQWRLANGYYATWDAARLADGGLPRAGRRHHRAPHPHLQLRRRRRHHQRGRPGRLPHPLRLRRAARTSPPSSMPTGTPSRPATTPTGARCGASSATWMSPGKASASPSSTPPRSPRCSRATPPSSNTTPAATWCAQHRQR